MPTRPEIPSERRAIEQELAAVYRLYASLAGQMDPEFGLGGKLLHVGDLDPAASRLVRAANIAGAASLAASADPVVLRQSIREGVVDFLVTSVDEALRILKNEIRKRQTVAVCVAAAAQQVMTEMAARGVLADLLSPSAAQAEQGTVFLAQGAQLVEAAPIPEGSRLLVLETPPRWAQCPADFDSFLLESVPEKDLAGRRWLRLSPRYLGPAARRLRSIECAEETAAVLERRLAEAECAG
jgi:hypothetical protein